MGSAVVAAVMEAQEMAMAASAMVAYAEPSATVEAAGCLAAAA